MAIDEIAGLFSTGKFEEVYCFVAENAEWNVIGENKFSGKQAIIDHCQQISAYFKSVTTDFTIINVISDKSKVA